MLVFKKDFWKYFFATYKNAKWLVLRYVIVAVYLTVSSIIANNMHLDNLTYYNAIIGLVSFCDIIGFGVSNGVGLYMNQNIKEKEKVDYYAKYGMYINFITSIIIVTLLAGLYKQILHTFLGLPQGIDYTFYFCMLIYIFLDCLLSYFIHTLKELKMFLAEMIVSLIQCILIVGGFVCIWLGFDLSLKLISIIYILSMVASLTFAIIYFYKNKIHKINLFKFVKIKFVKKEVVNIWRMSGAQIVWQVGFTILSYAILRSSVIVFNQYAYYENVLDIFNGLFFSFITLTSIDICRKLGESDFDNAYKIGKYSLYSNVVIWLVYFALSLAFSPLIIKGMSVDIQQFALLSMVLYITMHLFRFLSWNLISYILCWGGELKLLLWQEVASTIYLIIFYFVAPYLPSNIFLIYFIITFPTILQTIMGLIMFKRKKWMKNLTNNQIKVVVFDFDDTLYSGIDWSPWGDYILIGLNEVLKDNENKDKIISQVTSSSLNDVDIHTILKENNVDSKLFLTYRQNNLCKLDYHSCKVTDNQTIKAFAEKYTLYIVSNSTKNDIINTSKMLGLDLSPFKDIVCNDYNLPAKELRDSKKYLYKQIIESENIAPSQMFIIGNSMKSDINPALQIGAKGQQIYSADFKIEDFEL